MLTYTNVHFPLEAELRNLGALQVLIPARWPWCPQQETLGTLDCGSSLGLQKMVSTTLTHVSGHLKRYFHAYGNAGGWGVGGVYAVSV